MEDSGLDRRRFLKYAGATAAVVGASALGLADLLSPRFETPSQVATPTLTTTIRTSSLISPKALTSLDGSLFFDYNMNAIRDPGEPSVLQTKVELTSYDGQFARDVNTDIAGSWAIENVPAGKYSLQFYPDQRYRCICNSDEQFYAIDTSFGIALTEKLQILNFGVAEGFLTLPFAKGTRCDWGDSFDEGDGIDWTGQKGHIHLNWHNGPHEGHDLMVPWRTPVVAAAPGRVRYVDDWDAEGWSGGGSPTNLLDHFLRE